MIPSPSQFIERMAPDDRPVGRVLVPTLYLCAAAAAASMLAMMAIAPSLQLVLAYLPVTVALAVSLWAAWKGSVQVASHVYVITLAGITGVACLVGGGVRGQAFDALPGILVLAAVLLPRRSVVAFVVAECGLGAFLYLEPDTIDAWQILPTWPALQLVTYATTTAFIASVVFVVVDRFRRTVHQTEQRRSELDQALSALERTTVTRGHLDDVIRAVRDMIIVTDGSRNIVQANPAVYDRLGLHVERLQGRPIASLFLRPDGLDFVDGRSRHLAVMRSDGRHLSVLVSRGVLTENDGEVWVLTDISVQEAAVESIRRAHARADMANQAKSQFLANMSHELRTPLNAIIGYSELIAEEVSNQAHLQDLGRIRSSGQHLLGLINGILDLSKVEAGKMELELADVDLQVLTRRVADTVRPRIVMKGLDFRADCVNLDHPVRVDETKVTQILLNLLSNAAKFTERGSVELLAEGWTRQGVPWVRLVVTDTGRGMTDDQLDSVFEPFAQAHTEVVQGGTGLGLSISRAFARMMGGEIHVDSRPDRGTTFTVEIPVGSLNLDADPSSDPAASDAGAHGDQVVVVIDADRASVTMVSRLLENPGRTVLGTTDAVKGLGWIRAQRPALVLVDATLAKLSGWAVLTELRQEFTKDELRIVVLGSESDLGVAQALGANGLLQKPLDRQVLSALVESQLTG